VGSLAAVILNPPDLDAAERLLAKLHYDQNLTWNEKVPNNEAKGMARMLLNIFALAGTLFAALYHRRNRLWRLSGLAAEVGL
jgi:hypothetical protein